VRTPIGRISRLSLLLLAMIVAAIVTGLLLPGSAGTWVEAGGWLALAILIIVEVGFFTSPIGNYEGNDRRPRVPPFG
jgi:membrane protein implicated in regulation of membrane protease activity